MNDKPNRNRQNKTENKTNQVNHTGQYSINMPSRCDFCGKSPANHDVGHLNLCDMCYETF